MIPKLKQRSYILDKLHRGVVNVCIATTIIGATFCVYRGYYYYRYIRPAMKEIALKADEELLEEGKYTTVNT